MAPDATSSRILATEWGAARKSSRRWTRVTRSAIGCRLRTQSSAESPAARDDQPLAAELLHLAHGVEGPVAGPQGLVVLDLGDRRLLGLERAPARGDHHHRGLQHRALVGGQPPLAVGRLLQRHRHLAQMEGRAEGGDLLQQPVGQLLAGHHRQRGDVVDRLLRIELGALPAGLVQNVHQVGLHVQEAQLEHREQAHRARPHDDHVRRVRSARGGGRPGVGGHLVHKRSGGFIDG